MTPDVAFKVFEVSVAIAIVLWFFWFPWQDLCVALARQRLFELRDEMFLWAADGKLSFESPEYRALRERLNQSIRSCETFTWRCVLSYLISHPRFLSKHRPNDMIARLPDPTMRARVEGINRGTVIAMFGLLVIRSPLLLCLLPVLFPVFIVWLQTSGSLQRVLSVVFRDIDQDFDITNHRLT